MTWKMIYSLKEYTGLASVKQMGRFVKSSQNICNLKIEKQCVRNLKNLKGTNFFISEQFPKEITERRKKLLPRLKRAKEENRDAWISYDTLYIDVVAVRNIP